MRPHELLELRAGEHHDMNVLADDDARGGVVGELRVVRKTEGLEKGQGTREIRDRQIDEDLCAHV